MRVRKRAQLIERFSDPGYRHAFFSSSLGAYIASQIRANRKHHGWSQKELAEIAGMKQSRISTIEDVNYNRWTIKTLQRLAKAFDLTLSVRFESFGVALERIENFQESLVEPGFSQDERIHGRLDVVESNADILPFGPTKTEYAPTETATSLDVHPGVIADKVGIHSHMIQADAA